MERKKYESLGLQIFFEIVSFCLFHIACLTSFLIFAVLAVAIVLAVADILGVADILNVADIPDVADISFAVADISSVCCCRCCSWMFFM
jgi:hypothetical protein